MRGVGALIAVAIGGILAGKWWASRPAAPALAGSMMRPIAALPPSTQTLRFPTQEGGYASAVEAKAAAREQFGAGGTATLSVGGRWFPAQGKPQVPVGMAAQFARLTENERAADRTTAQNLRLLSGGRG